MKVRSVSPGGALLRSSRMFAMPKPLSDSTIGSETKHGSNTATRSFPQYQSITSPFASREKGDWGLKRSLPLKQTMATTTPSLRIKEIDSVEKITDYASSADHSLSLEKFKEMRIAMNFPPEQKNFYLDRINSRTHLKSVFEEDYDFTAPQKSYVDDRRWKFKGPWLARLSEGDFVKYLNSHVRPKRSEFKNLLRKDFAAELTARQNQEARDAGEPLPPAITERDITPEDFTQFLRLLRDDRPKLYALISKFLDLAPLGKPIGFMDNSGIIFKNKSEESRAGQSPYGNAGPPPSHPSAGLSYLRTNSVMDNHAVYGPQAQREPVLARIISPRHSRGPAKIGVGGFITTVPSGDNDFNTMQVRGRNDRQPLAGVSHLDINTFGGAKAYVDPYAASINPDGNVIIQTRTAGEETQRNAKEAKGKADVYGNGAMKRYAPSTASATADRVSNGVTSQDEQPPQVKERDIFGSSSSYGLGNEE